MFEDLVESTPGGRKKTNKWWTVILSTGLQVLALAVILIIPLLVTPALPKALSGMYLAPPPPAAPPPAPVVQKIQVVKPQVRMIDQGRLVAPKSIPKQVTLVKEEELPPDVPTSGVSGGVVGGVPGGMTGGVLGGIIGGSSSAAPPPPPPKEVVPQRIQQGGEVEKSKLVNQVLPVYPHMAQQMRVQGIVRLHAVISKDGRVTELNLVSGPPMLVQAAMDAVKQWRFSPTLLNTVPVEVECVFDVKFVL